MSASTSESCTGWQEPAKERSQPWIGLLMIAASGVVTFRVLGLAVSTIARYVMQ